MHLWNILVFVTGAASNGPPKKEVRRHCEAHNNIKQVGDKLYLELLRLLGTDNLRKEKLTDCFQNREYRVKRDFASCPSHEER